MKIDLSGVTAIVTGSTGGIGFAISGLAECGATVVVNGLKIVEILDGRFGAPEDFQQPSGHVTDEDRLELCCAAADQRQDRTASQAGFRHATLATAVRLLHPQAGKKPFADGNNSPGFGAFPYSF